MNYAFLSVFNILSSLIKQGSHTFIILHSALYYILTHLSLALLSFIPLLHFWLILFYSILLPHIWFPSSSSFYSVLLSHSRFPHTSSFHPTPVHFIGYPVCICSLKMSIPSQNYPLLLLFHLSFCHIHFSHSPFFLLIIQVLKKKTSLGLVLPL